MIRFIIYGSLKKIDTSNAAETRITDRRLTTRVEMQPNREQRRAGCDSSQHDGATGT